MRRFSLAALALLGSAGHGTASDPLSVEALLSAPFPSELTAAPAGGALAWVQNDRGERNAWAAEPPDYSARPLTRFSGDDGQALDQLRFTPDGAALLFVRGGPPNGAGEVPNPTSAAAGAERAIWIVALAGGEPARLAQGDSPAVHPGGERIAFLREGKLFGRALGPDAEAEPLVRHRGAGAELRWSPDGARLAFVSRRGSHGFVGVFDPATGAVRYLNPSTDRDSSPVWSPAGDRLAFLRVPSAEAVPFHPRRSGEPWSIRVADPETGTGRELFRAREGRGSVFSGVVAESQLVWSAGDRIVFPWERSGWRLLYSVAAEGGEPSLLTPGDFEVEHVAPSADRRGVVFSSNQGDLDRRHLWRVDASGGPPRPLTAGTGIEWSPVETGDGGAVAMLRSDARRPARAALLVPGREPRDLAPATLPAHVPWQRLAAPEPVIVSAADGLRVHGQLFAPAAAKPGRRHPAVIFFHGGSRRQMLLGWHYLGYYHNAYALNQHLAGRGYLVLSLNYRSGVGYGLDFREAPRYGAGGASEFADVLGAGLYLRGRDDVDPERIGLWGGSYGGYLTALGLARASDLFAAGVDIHGVHDWNVVIRNFMPDYAPSPEQQRQALESSPMAFLDGWRSPVLLIHGDDDRNVPFSETVDLVRELRARGVELEQLVFPDEVHGFLLHESWLAAYGAAVDFLERRLAGGR